jgi:hypothetical protein
LIIPKTSTQEQFKNIKSNLRIRSMKESAPKDRTPACKTVSSPLLDYSKVDIFV